MGFVNDPDVRARRHHGHAHERKYQRTMGGCLTCHSPLSQASVFVASHHASITMSGLLLLGDRARVHSLVNKFTSEQYPS